MSGIVFFLIVVCGFPLSSSAGSGTPASALKVALLPIIDSLPFYVAESKGYFQNAGVEVRIVPVMSGLQRDQLMQAGEIDGMLNEMMTAANFNRKRIQVKIVYSIRYAQADFPMFRIVAAPKSGLSSTAGLAGASVGISRNTIIEYVTDRLVAAKGLDPNRILKKSVPAIPERFQLLMRGQLKAAVLPDPLASAALVAGGTLIVDDAAYPQYSVSVFSFSMDSIRRRFKAIKRFLRAWDRASSELNRSPESHRPLMLKKIRIPKNVAKSYAIPLFSRSSVPNVRQWEDVMKWMVAKGLLKAPLVYDQSVTRSFLP
ncbi:MAG: ABC transporter substrate-binding protein [Proteobacteria bacterium]|nr:ABC transporter substrate-binding protein [Pseudomonadota bacterium]